jgi:hypothetical protein
MKKFDIRSFFPCPEGLEYYESKASAGEAWNDCPRGDWMLWIAAELGIDDRLLVKAKALCANTVRHLMTDKRSTDAIDAALRYADSRIDRKGLRVYISEANNAYIDAYKDDYHSAYAHAACAAYTACIRYDYGGAANYAAFAAYYAAYADTAAYVNAAYANARAANLKQTADICREVLTDAVFEKVNEILKHNKNE